MKLKNGLLTLACLTLAASCGSDSNDSASSTSNPSIGTIGAQLPGEMTSLTRTSQDLIKEVASFNGLTPKESNVIEELTQDFTWWNDADVWKLRDSRVVCAEDLSVCDNSMISAKTYIGLELSAPTSSPRRGLLTDISSALEGLCSVGAILPTDSLKAGKVANGTYKVEIGSFHSQSVMSKCAGVIEAGSTVSIEASDTKDIAIYDSKVTVKITKDSMPVRDVTYYYKDNELATNMASFEKDYRVSSTEITKTVILHNKEFGLFRAESIKADSSFAGTPKLDKEIEISRLYKNTNGLAIAFKVNDSEHATHGRETVAYALKGNLIYPELQTEMNIALTNYKQLTDARMACFENATALMSKCDVSRSIEFWNARSQAEAIYSDFNSENLEATEYTVLNFINDDEVVTGKLSTK